jgi:[acyl-carrier-protein] S-malonyltransferase
VSGTAFLCPGQGAQHVGMGRDLCAEFPVARRTFEEASTRLGEDLEALCFTGPEETLTLTANAQPALLAMSIAIARVLGELGTAPQIAAGHSLGEWSALVIAGSLEFGDAIAAVRERGRFMQEAVAPGVGAMSALLGADLDVAAELCREASIGEASLVVPANVNGAGQIVVAGHVAAVERLEALAKARKVRSMRVKVSAPFHSPLMAPARERMAEILASLRIAPPRFPVLSNVDGEPHGEPQAIRAALEAQITAPVQWERCARVIAARAARAIEVGPGKVLGGLMRRIAPEFPCVPTGDVAGVRAAAEGHS